MEHASTAFSGLQEVESLRQQLSNYDKDKMTLQLTKQRLLHADKQLKNLEWEKEVLSQRFTRIETERNELFAKFESSVQEVQQKTGLKKMLLEKKVEALNQALEKKQTQLAEVLVAANMDSGTLQNVRYLICINVSHYYRLKGDSERDLSMLKQVDLAGRGACPCSEMQQGHFLLQHAGAQEA